MKYLVKQLSAEDDKLFVLWLNHKGLAQLQLYHQVKSVYNYGVFYLTNEQEQQIHSLI